MKTTKPFLAGAAVLSVFSAGSAARVQTSADQKPNIIYILADDLGYGDLSCYGQKRFKTPNIDRLAKEGMLFTQHYAGCTVCAPSRSSLLTGLTTGHTPIRGNKSWEPEGQYPIPANTFTMAEMLKQAGYYTGAFGKWGLGFIGTEGDPNKQGFDEFYGYNCQSLAHNYYPAYLWDNHTKVSLKGNSGNQFNEYAPQLIHDRALQFIEKQNPAKTGKPFFLFYPNVIPHAELLIPDENIQEFRGKLLPEKPYRGTEPGSANFRTGGYGSQNETHAAFAAMVTLLDKQVGEVVAKLKELGLDKNTIIIFSSDNGPHLEGGADPDYFDSNGVLKGYKRDLYEGGIRVPMIACWPGKIKPGSTTNHVSAFWDVMPTVADIAGISVPENLDGISFLPSLTGQGKQMQHETLYWEFHELKGRQALRMGNWKLVRYQALTPDQATTELYDLNSDVGEERNIASQHPELVAKMIRILNQSRVSSEIFTFQPEVKTN
ncbi:MAG: arylsulfatase [Prolixibacteraceae bacterium]|nr:arylsulfatase [Prolixibacteraceae bacterium]